MAEVPEAAKYTIQGRSDCVPVEMELVEPNHSMIHNLWSIIDMFIPLKPLLVPWLLFFPSFSLQSTEESESRHCHPSGESGELGLLRGWQD